MTIIFICIVIAAVMSTVLWWYIDKGNCLNLGTLLIHAALTIATGFAAVAYAFTIWYWVASEYKTDIINREYGTSYTREEIFYADGVIETIQQLQRKRIEVNGDLMKGE